MAPDTRHEQLVKIARLYYLEEMNQKDIATKMNMSLAGVSRSITKARENGIVTISVNAPGYESSELEILIEKKYGISECLLVETAASADVMYADMAAKLSLYLGKVLTKNTRVGVSWGLTLKTIGDNLPTRSEACKAVVPIIGAVGQIETGIFPNSIARNFATKLGCDSYLVNSPGMVDSKEIRQTLISDSSFSTIARLWSQLDIVIFSVSGFSEGDSVTDFGVIPAKDLKVASGDGAAMVANFLFFDAEGQPVSTGVSERIINLSYDQLMNIPERIIVAAGSQKTGAIRAALSGGLCQVLITDVETATELIQ